MCHDGLLPNCSGQPVSFGALTLPVFARLDLLYVCEGKESGTLWLRDPQTAALNAQVLRSFWPLAHSIATYRPNNLTWETSHSRETRVKVVSIQLTDDFSQGCWEIGYRTILKSLRACAEGHTV